MPLTGAATHDQVWGINLTNTSQYITLHYKMVTISHSSTQSFSKVALSGSKPPTPDESRAWCRFGAGAPKRHHALELFFGAERGRGKRRLRSPALQHKHRLPDSSVCFSRRTLKRSP